MANIKIYKSRVMHFCASSQSLTISEILTFQLFLPSELVSQRQGGQLSQ